MPKRNQAPRYGIHKAPLASEVAERSLLGSLFFDHDEFYNVLDTVTPEDFYSPANKVIAQALWDCWTASKTFDATMVYEYVKKRDQLGIVGGHEGFFALCQAMPEGSHAKHYAETVRGFSVRRRIIEMSRRLQQEAVQSDDVTGLLHECQDMVHGLSLKMYRSPQESLAALVRQEVRNLDEPERYGGGLTTGFLDLDAMLGSLLPGDYVILAGRPSMGKTSLALNIVDYIAVTEKRPVLIISLETTGAQLARNWLAQHGRVSANKIRQYRITPQEHTKLSLASGSLDGVKVLVDTAASSMLDIVSAVRIARIRHDIGLMVLDHVQLVQAEVHGESRQREMAEVSRVLKRIAVDNNIPILVLSQLSRAVEHRADKRPILSDLRESGAYEQDADVVLLLYRDEYYKPKTTKAPGVAELCVAKQRNGPTGVIRLTFLKEILRFYDKARGDEDDGDYRGTEQDYPAVNRGCPADTEIERPKPAGPILRDEADTDEGHTVQKQPAVDPRWAHGSDPF